jgi:hypothetical protein
VHRREVALVLAQRERALETAFLTHPERFKGRRPHAPAPPTAVWINPPALDRNGEPSPRSRQNLRIGDGQGKDDALIAPESDATEAAKGPGTPEIELIAPLDDVEARRVVTSAGH